ncbi:MAG: DUF1015 family protein [Chloroflexota bacterium]
MPTLRAFRALRYAHAPGADLTSRLCPPYDIIASAQHATLLGRDPHNAVRLELPEPEPGGPPDSRYAAAAGAIAAWRAQGILVEDAAPAVTIHAMDFTARDGTARTATGVLARLRLEPFSADGGVRRHERTLTGPKEDRFRLLRATETNLSPVVLLADAARAAARTHIDRLTARPPDALARTDDGSAHRIWICPEGSGADDVASLLAALGAGPLTIADGHHRYETALRYRDERRAAEPAAVDPAWDGILALVYPIDDAPPVLPTHRVLLAGPSGAALLAAIADLVEVEPVADAAALAARMAQPAPLPSPDATGTGRIGLVSGDVAAVLRIRDGVTAGTGTSAASRGLDVNRLLALLARLGIDDAALAAGDRVAYVKVVGDALARVQDGAAAAFLLDGPPASAVTRVAAAGEVMPQKSTYFDPKAPTGICFGPLGA